MGKCKGGIEIQGMRERRLIQLDMVNGSSLSNYEKEGDVISRAIRDKSRPVSHADG